MSSSVFQTPLEFKKRKIQNYPQKKVIILAGPTATGKTDLSIQLAKRLKGEVVSADSMQVYRGLDIGTAKATLDQIKEVPHHLIDIRDVNEPYNVAAYVRDATEVICHLLAENKTPIIVGGNGFYLHSLIYGPPKGPSSVPEIRKRIEEDLEKFGVEMLFNKLKLVDPEYASTITLQDRHKIVRALEIITITNKKVSEFPKPNYDSEEVQFNFLCYFMYFPKPILYERIERRCDLMLEQGLVHETEKMLPLGLSENSSAKNAIGYRQVLDFLETDQSHDAYQEFVSNFKKASRHYAKRQFTWFKKEPLFEWIDMSKTSQYELVEKISSDFLS
jgi:tRNA dimethylallyltransferase